MSDLVSKMANALPDLPKKLALAARYAIDNPDRIAFDSMRSVAATLNVASPTMLRLARTFGYESYEAFRSEFQASVSEPSFTKRAAGLRSAFDRGMKDEIARGIADAATENLGKTIGTLNSDDIERFAVKVRSAPRTFIIGTGSMHWLAALMQSTGVIALSGLRKDDVAGATSVEALASITNADVVLALGIAPYAKRTIEAVLMAKARGAETFCITDRRSSPLLHHCDTAFLAATDSPHYYPSIVAVMLVVEILLAATIAGTASIERIQAFDRARKETGAYLD